MGMTETGIIGAAAVFCLTVAVIVRIWTEFVQREGWIKDRSLQQLDAGISQTTGNREIQADRVQVTRTQAGILAVIADGIGKKNIGQVCAQIAMDTVLDRFEPYHVLNRPDYFFRTVFYEANRRIQMTLGDGQGGASLGVVFADRGQLYYALAGNIRIALLRGGELIPLSRGQTLDVLAVQAWKDGKISRQEAVWSMEEKRLWNHLGMDGFHEIETPDRPVQLKPGDVVFLATCGIFEELSWSQLEDILTGEGSLTEQADAVVQAAEQKEGAQKENGSVVLFRVFADGMDS